MRAWTHYSWAALLGCSCGWVSPGDSGCGEMLGKHLLQSACGPQVGKGKLLLWNSMRTQVNLCWVLLGAWQAVVLVKVVQAQLCSVALYSS